MRIYWKVEYIDWKPVYYVYDNGVLKGTFLNPVNALKVLRELTEEAIENSKEIKGSKNV